MLGAYDALGLPVVFGRCMLLQLKWPPVEDELQSPARQSSHAPPWPCPAGMEAAP